MTLKPFFIGVKEGQKEFGEDVAFLVNLALTGVVYFIGVGLTSLFAKLGGKKFLTLAPDADAQTYWEDLNLDKKEKEAYYRQF